MFGLRRRGVSVTGPALVLTQFDTDPADPKTLLNLVGRPEGIVGWFLSTVGVDITTTLSITQDFVHINKSGLSSRFRQTAPVHNIASTHCGFSMNLFLIVLAGLAFFGGLIAAAAFRTIWPLPIGIVVACLFVLGFFLSKCLVIAFETSGGIILGVRFKKGLIENVPVGIEQLSEVLARFNQQLQRMPSTVSAAAPPKKVEQWYYSKDGQKTGPLSASELKQMVHSGQLSSQVMLWKDGMANWEPVSKFKWG
ncbi:MAG: DUF4339 domain-containing protein [Gemmataceae bacterium]|nr:DUF4339 domain-containing protein [Gemmataceae bacterium]